MAKYLYIVTGGLIAITIIASLFINVIGAISFITLGLLIYVLLGTIMLWLCIKLFNRLELFSWTFRLGTPLKYFLMLGLVALSGVLAVHAFAPAATIEGSDSSTKDQVAYMFETDQADRVAMRLFSLSNRDAARRSVLLKLLNDQPLDDPEAKYHAAMILQHGAEPAHFEQAHQLALEASEAGVEESEWLSKAAYDRWQISIGKPQLYNTQTNATISLFGLAVEE